MVAGNGPDDDMTEVVIPPDFLSKLYLGRCAYDEPHACSSPASQVF